MKDVTNDGKTEKIRLVLTCFVRHTGLFGWQRGTIRGGKICECQAGTNYCKSFFFEFSAVEDKFSATKERMTVPPKFNWWGFTSGSYYLWVPTTREVRCGKHRDPLLVYDAVGSLCVSPSNKLTSNTVWGHTTGSAGCTQTFLFFGIVYVYILKLV